MKFSASSPPPWGWPEAVLLAQTVFPALLYLPGAQAVRTPLRAAPFLIAVVPLLLANPRPGVRHPAAPLASLVVGLLALLVLHPDAPGLLPAVGEAVLLAAIVAPLFWVPGRVRGPAHLRRLLLLLLAGTAASSVVGVLQVYDPDRWLPAELARSAGSLDRLTYRTADGRLVVRPPGLSDTPGAVCAAGGTAALLGLAVAAAPGPVSLRLAAAGAAVLGLTAVYLTHVRTNLVVFVAGVGVTAAVLLVQRQPGSAARLTLTAAGLVAVALAAAVGLAGGGVTERFATLLDDDPAAVYARSRGAGTWAALTEDLFDFPVGAGLGTWGPTAVGLGGGGRFAEEQIPGWVLDGGLPLLVLYPLLLAVAATHDWRTAVAVRPPLGVWAAAVLGLNAGTLLLTLSFVPFHTPAGLQFWLLAGALHGAARGGGR